jgi:hypothetical protein
LEFGKPDNQGDEGRGELLRSLTEVVDEATEVGLVQQEELPVVTLSEGFPKYREDRLVVWFKLGDKCVEELF